MADEECENKSCSCEDGPFRVVKEPGEIVVNDVIGMTQTEEECTNMQTMIVTECQGYCNDSRVEGQSCAIKRLSQTMPFQKFLFRCKSKCV